MGTLLVTFSIDPVPCPHENGSCAATTMRGPMAECCRAHVRHRQPYSPSVQCPACARMDAWRESLKQKSDSKYISDRELSERAAKRRAKVEAELAKRLRPLKPTGCPVVALDAAIDRPITRYLLTMGGYRLAEGGWNCGCVTSNGRTVRVGRDDMVQAEIVTPCARHARCFIPTDLTSEAE